MGILFVILFARTRVGVIIGNKKIFVINAPAPVLILLTSADVNHALHVALIMF